MSQPGWLLARRRLSPEAPKTALGLDLSRLSEIPCLPLYFSFSPLLSPFSPAALLPTSLLNKAGTI